VRLLRLYPPAWRERYGEELESLIDELGGVARMSWRARSDVVRAALIERGRALSLSGLPPRERAREGSLLVLYAWMFFVIGGFGVEKASEQWRAVTPIAKQGVPSAAFDALVVTAIAGSTLVLLGVALALPELLKLIRAGGWVRIRRPVIRALFLSGLTGAAMFALALWAHRLAPAARNGADASYGAAFLLWVTLFAASLLAWASAAAATARCLGLAPPILRVQARLGAAVSVSMTVMTLATVVWWTSLASAAPWFFDGRHVGSPGSALTPNIALPAGVLLLATLLGLTGATRALRALAADPPQV
jgi:hypothetical protein